MNYKLTIQYDGGRYKGWQRLESENTVQGKIEQVLSEMAGRRVEINGCSRTDAGVHAMAQIANFKLKEAIHPQEIKRYLNRYLPQDISVTAVDQMPEEFHARLHAKRKTYVYQIWNEAHGNPFLRRFSMHVEKKLDLKSMREAAKHLLGTHDFTAFSNAKSKTKSMMRTVHSIEIAQDAGLISIRVCGDGFLHNMVRRVAGVLIEAGLREIDPDSVPEILITKRRSEVGVTAEACGLILESIEY